MYVGSQQACMEGMAAWAAGTKQKTNKVFVLCHVRAQGRVLSFIPKFIVTIIRKIPKEY